MNCMAFRALPDTNAQIFYPWISVAARAAGLTARIHRWYFADFISVPCSFIFKIGNLHPDDLSRIEDMYRKFLKDNGAI